MSESGWWQRHGAVFTSIITLISVLTYSHVSLSAIRDEMRTEMGKLRNEIRGELRDFRAALDRVESKVDEVRGYLRFNASVPPNELTPKE